LSLECGQVRPRKSVPIHVVLRSSNPGQSLRDLKEPVHACLPKRHKQLNDLPDDLITKVNILYYTDAREALLKAIVE
jgi:hypothetical protein